MLNLGFDFFAKRKNDLSLRKYSPGNPVERSADVAAIAVAVVDQARVASATDQVPLVHAVLKFSNSASKSQVIRTTTRLALL